MRLVGLLGVRGVNFPNGLPYPGDSEQDVGSESPRYFLKRLFPQPL